MASDQQQHHAVSERAANLNLSAYSDAIGLVKTSGKNYDKTAEATRRWAVNINKDFVTHLKSEGIVTMKGLKQYQSQLMTAIEKFKARPDNKSYSVQEARLETVNKVLELW